MEDLALIIIVLSFILYFYWGSVILSIIAIPVFWHISTTIFDFVTETKAVRFNRKAETTALVTGGSYGIGFEFCKLLARDGYQLIIVARNEQKLKEAKKILEGINQKIKIVIISKDLGVPGAAKELCDELNQSNLKVDILINNAGFGDLAKFSEANTQVLESLLECNCNNLVLLTRYLLPGMIEKKKGKILNISSVAGFVPGPTMVSYYASKALVNSFSLGLNWELRGTGVTSTILCPGAVESEFGKRAGTSDSLLFKLGTLTSKRAALSGYKGMIRGDAQVIPDFVNWIIVLAQPFLPSSLVILLSSLLLK